jgi:hypothetical protein
MYVVALIHHPTENDGSIQSARVGEHTAWHEKSPIDVVITECSTNYTQRRRGYSGKPGPVPQVVAQKEVSGAE